MNPEYKKIANIKEKAKKQREKWVGRKPQEK